MKNIKRHDWFPKDIPNNVIIGEKTYFDSSYSLFHYNSQRSCGLKIGDHCGIYVGTFFELGETGQVNIDNYTAVVGAIISTNGAVNIGKYCFIAHEVVIADSNDPVPSTSKGEGLIKQKLSTKKDIYIGDNVWIGTRAIILGGAKIGQGSVVGAAAVVDFEVPPFSIVAGNPAKIVKAIK